MLPVYNALILEKENVQGGTTLPCIMTIGNDNGKIIGTYVVKVFSQRHIEQYNPTNKEIIANYLADEFGLIVPKMAIIYVSQKIIDELQTYKAYQNLVLSAGYYFGCQYIENTLSYEIGLKRNNYEIWELETIFAFDVFIRNFDRRIGKPNILFKKNNFILIDHDLSLDIRKLYSEYKAFDSYQNVIQGVKGQHIFLKHLRNLHKKKPITFDDFIESLRTLNIRKVQHLKDFIQSLPLNTSDFEAIITYLEAIKQDLNGFRQILLTNL